MSGILEVLDLGIVWEDSVHHKEDKVHEDPELDCSVVAGALGVLAQSEAELQAQDSQIGNQTVFGVG